MPTEAIYRYLAAQAPRWAEVRPTPQMVEILLSMEIYALKEGAGQLARAIREITLDLQSQLCVG